MRSRWRLRTGSVEGARQLDQLGTPGSRLRQAQEGRIEVALAGFVGQRLATQIEYLAADSLQYALRSRSIPLRSGREARIAVGIALGQQAELQRAADIGQLQIAETLGQAAQQAFLSGAGVALARHQGEGLGRRQAHTDRLGLAVRFLAPGAQAGTAVIAAT